MPTVARPLVLLTGFEPFDTDPVNPAWEVARRLDGWQDSDFSVRSLQLPCVFGRAIERLDQALAECQPKLVICLGLAGGRSEVCVERVAINRDDARILDNAGQQPIDLAVVAGGPAAYFSSLPIKAIVRDLRAAGLPGAVSNTAGTFVCNHIFYALMHRLAQAAATNPGAADSALVRGGFVHLPYLPEQAARNPGAPSMALETQLAAVRCIIQTAFRQPIDVRENAGQLH